MNDAFTVLGGELTKLVLPNTVRLFVSQGLPQLFRDLTPTTETPDQFPWLYLPPEQIDRLKLAVPADGAEEMGNNISWQPFSSDDLNLYPVFVRGDLAAVLLSDTGSEIKLTTDTATRLTDCLESYIDAATRADEDIFGRYIGSLFAVNSTAEVFAKRALEFMIHLTKNITGAVYYDFGQGYRLRFIAGTLGNYDQLPGRVEGTCRQKWMRAVRRGDFFTPAELLPDNATILADPPRFQFVHPGMQSDDSNSLIALIIPGDIDLATTTNLKRVAGLTSKLHDSQFSRSAHLVSMYRTIAGMKGRVPALEELIMVAFRTLSSEAKISRLAVVEPDGKGTMVFKSSEGDCITACHRRLIDSTVIDQLISRDRFIASDNLVAEPGAVVSELYVPVRHKHRLKAVVALGSALEAENLLNHRDFLCEVAEFVADFYRRENLSGRSRGNGCIWGANLPVCLRRLSTIGRLAEADFHEANSLLSVMIGQAEIIECLIAAEDEQPVSGRIASGMGRINEAAVELGESLNSLAGIWTGLAPDFSSGVSGHDLLEQLPLLLDGSLRHLRETRGISLTVATRQSDALDLSLSNAFIYDCLVPLILGLIDLAASAGQIAISAGRHKNAQEVIVEFEDAIIGGTPTSVVVNEVFQHNRASALSVGGYEINLDGIHLSYDADDRERRQVRFLIEQPINGPSENLYYKQNILTCRGK